MKWFAESVFSVFFLMTTLLVALWLVASPFCTGPELINFLMPPFIGVQGDAEHQTITLDDLKSDDERAVDGLNQLLDRIDESDRRWNKAWDDATTRLPASKKSMIDQGGK